MKSRKQRVSKTELKYMGERWITAREKAGLTQAALAQRLEKTGSYISLIEAGLRVPDVMVIKKAAQILGVGLEVLCP